MSTETPAAAEPVEVDQGQQDMDAFAASVESVFGEDRDTVGIDPFAQETSDTPVSVGAEAGEGGEGAEPLASTPSEPVPTPPKPQPSRAVPAQPPAQQTTTPAAPPDSEAALAAASKDAELARLKAEVERLSAQTAAPASQGTQQQDQPKPAEAQQGFKPYNVQLPPQLLAAVSSDDPNQQAMGITTLVNGLMTSMHQNMNKELENFRNTLKADQAAQQTQAQTQTQQQEAVASMQTQYFEKFPAHQGEQMAPIVSQVAGALAAEYPGANWDDNYMAALGARVNAYLEGLGVSQVKPVTQANNPIPKAPAAMVPTATRATTPTGELSFAEESKQVLGFG